jgi:hypothetical protein
MAGVAMNASDPPVFWPVVVEAGGLMTLTDMASLSSSSRALIWFRMSCTFFVMKKILSFWVQDAKL